jgi:hypothetical protein
MWLTWLKTAAAGLLAFATATGLVAVWHDQPYVYPAVLRTRWLTLFIRASPRHVVVGGWRTAEHDLLGSDQPYWEGLGLDVYTETVGNREERTWTDVLYATTSHCARLGEFGVLHGIAVPPVRSWTEAMVPTWLAVAAGVVPLVVVVVGRVRRGGRVEQGHCPVCGYDLRATPGRCPECGTSPVPIASR